MYFFAQDQTLARLSTSALYSININNQLYKGEYFMQRSAAESVEATTTDCAFCLHDDTTNNDIVRYTLKETSTFRIVTDHAPLVEGHLLIIPKTHYACYGAAPAELDAELFALKDEARRFLSQFYANVIFW